MTLLLQEEIEADKQKSDDNIIIVKKKKGPETPSKEGKRDTEW